MIGGPGGEDGDDEINYPHVGQSIDPPEPFPFHSQALECLI